MGGMSSIEKLGGFGSLRELASGVARGDFSPFELASYYLDRIEASQPQLNAFIKWDRSEAEASCRKQIEVLMARRKAGEKMPLFGVPYGIKDNICTKDWQTTAASRVLDGFTPVYDASVVSLLREAGCVVLGKLNMDEFAMGSSSETSYFGPVRNPWDTARVPGGSSGGSAAAVSAGMVPFSLGSDTGGSVRQPAGFCGVVGFKPTYGTVSRYGLIAFGSSLDQVGPITRSVEDALEVYKVISGLDALDATSRAAPSLAGFSSEGVSLRGVRVGRVREFEESLGEASPCVAKAYEDSLRVLGELGAKVCEVSIPSLPYTLPTYYILACGEASSNLSRFDGVRYGFRSQEFGESLKDLYVSSRSKGFGREVKKRIMLGTYVLSAGYKDAYYKKALYSREMLKREYESALGGVDLLVSPSSPVPAFRVGDKLEDSLSMYLSDVFTLLHNLVGAPAICLPCGFSKERLPIGLQFSALSMGEEKLFNGAMSYERYANVGYQRP